MPKVKLTDRFVATRKATGAQTEYFDETTTGLALRITPRVKAWTYHYTIDGKRARAPLGIYPGVSLSGARTRALEAKASLAEGRKPSFDSPDATSLKGIAEEWKARKGDLRTLDARWRALERHVFPDLGARPVRDIRRSEIVRLLDDIEDSAGTEMADAIVGFLSALFNWHAARDDDFVNPIIRGMRRSKGNGRQRILTDAEIKAVWNAAEGPYGRYVRFLLLTAVRRREASKAEWAEVTDSVWTVPAARMKQGLDHVVPLSALALAEMKPNNHQWIFTVSGDRGLTNFAVYKTNLDKASGVKDWRLHDLRRTARSLLGRAGVPAEIAERCLAHVPGGVQGRYDRYEYLPEKRDALERLAKLIGEVVRG
ncbi:MAG TPA: integrase arm-type DNA-binding domain-containing protein [Xanthobacteraceae bacterium]|nr:integrase arm-type DNA-binding domain-containing protein [Xanthobacteraceae bacterium]